MPNMSYCRFECTLADLRDCYENMDNNLEDYPEEREARKKLVSLCARITNEYGD